MPHPNRPKPLSTNHQHLSDFIQDAAPEVPRLHHDLRIIQSLRRIIRATDLFSRRLVKQHKITGPQLMCLHKIVESEGLTIAELSRSIYLSASTVVGIIDRLERQGLATRQRSVSDRRKVLIHATQEGRDVLIDAPSPLQKALQSGLNELEEPEQKRIADTLEHLVDILELERVDAAPMLEIGPIDPGSLPRDDSENHHL